MPETMPEPTPEPAPTPDPVPEVDELDASPLPAPEPKKRGPRKTLTVIVPSRQHAPCPPTPASAIPPYLNRMMESRTPCAATFPDEEEPEPEPEPAPQEKPKRRRGRPPNNPASDASKSAALKTAPKAAPKKGKRRVEPTPEMQVEAEPSTPPMPPRRDPPTMWSPRELLQMERQAAARAATMPLIGTVPNFPSQLREEVEDGEDFALPPAILEYAERRGPVHPEPAEPPRKTREAPVPPTERPAFQEPISAANKYKPVNTLFGQAGPAGPSRPSTSRPTSTTQAQFQHRGYALAGHRIDPRTVLEEHPGQHPLHSRPVQSQQQGQHQQQHSQQHAQHHAPHYRVSNQYLDRILGPGPSSARQANFSVGPAPVQTDRYATSPHGMGGVPLANRSPNISLDATYTEGDTIVITSDDVLFRLDGHDLSHASRELAAGLIPGPEGPQIVLRRPYENAAMFRAFLSLLLHTELPLDGDEYQAGDTVRDLFAFLDAWGSNKGKVVRMILRQKDMSLRTALAVGSAIEDDALIERALRKYARVTAAVAGPGESIFKPGSAAHAAVTDPKHWEYWRYAATPREYVYALTSAWTGWQALRAPSQEMEDQLVLHFRAALGEARAQKGRKREAEERVGGEKKMKGE
jgi:hypothetical protein